MKQIDPSLPVQVTLTVAEAGFLLEFLHDLAEDAPSMPEKWFRERVYQTLSDALSATMDANPLKEPT